MSSAPTATTSSTSHATAWSLCQYWPLPEYVSAGISTTAASASGDDESDIEFSEQSAGVMADIAHPSRSSLWPAVDASPDVPAHAPAPVGAGGGGFEITGDEIDDEIREVFLEEFEEEIDNLDKMLPAWRAAPEDMETLRPIRRVFHTLKGSGRLVGAKTLGEFSWKSRPCSTACSTARARRVRPSSPWSTRRSTPCRNCRPPCVAKPPSTPTSTGCRRWPIASLQARRRSTPRRTLDRAGRVCGRGGRLPPMDVPGRSCRRRSIHRRRVDRSGPAGNPRHRGRRAPGHR